MSALSNNEFRCIEPVFSHPYNLTKVNYHQKEILIETLLKSLSITKELKFHVNPKKMPNEDFYLKHLPNAFANFASAPSHVHLCYVSRAFLEEFKMKADSQIPNLFWGRKVLVIHAISGEIIGETEDRLESPQAPLYPIEYKLKYIFAKETKISTKC